MSDAVLLLCTAGTRDEAETIARALIEEKLAACVQLSGIESWYRWEGAVEHSPEWRLHIKTAPLLARTVEARIKTLHSYDLPEIVALPIEGSADYLRWIGESVG